MVSVPGGGQSACWAAGGLPMCSTPPPSRNFSWMSGEVFQLLSTSTQTALSFEGSNRRRKVEDEEQQQIQLFSEVVSSEGPLLWSSCPPPSRITASPWMDGHTRVKRCWTWDLKDSRTQAAGKRGEEVRLPELLKHQDLREREREGWIEHQLAVIQEEEDHTAADGGKELTRASPALLHLR